MIIASQAAINVSQQLSIRVGLMSVPENSLTSSNVEENSSGGFNPVRRAQVGLGIAALGAVLLIFPFGKTSAIAGVIMIAAGAVIGSSFERKSHGWWFAFIAGAVLSVTSPGLAQISTTYGGVFALIGGTLILVSAVIAFPVGDEAP